MELIIDDFNGNKEGVNSNEDIIKKADEYLISINKPRDFHTSNPKNVTNEMDRSFENLCTALEEAGVQNPKRLTTYEFYSKVEYFENKKPKA